MSQTLLTPRALYEEVAERLRTRIFAHELPPGSWIDELALASEFGISRTPLREALKVLASEGLVTMKVRRGCYVTEVSERDLDEIFTVLALLEGQAAREAAARATPEQLQQLRVLHERLEHGADKGDIEGYFDANQAFHLKILEIADNQWLINVIADLRKVLKLNRHNSLFKAGRLQESLSEHRAILAALEARDAPVSEAAMREHLRHGRTAAGDGVTA